MTIELLDTIPGDHGEKTFVFQGDFGDPIYIRMKSESRFEENRYGVYLGRKRLGGLVGDMEECARQYAFELLE